MENDPRLLQLSPADNVLVAIHAAAGIDIPEADYPKLSSLDACVAYLAAKMGPG